MLTADDPRHGTANAYTNHNCRCDACREAHTAYLREKKIGSYKPSTCPSCSGPKHMNSALCQLCNNKLREAQHGTEQRYKRCYCDECREASRVARANRRRRAANDAVASDR